MNLKRGLVVHKIRLIRGYGWINTPMIGVIFVGAVKSIFPGFVDTTPKAFGWGIVGMLVMYLIGYIDQKRKFFQEENDYITEENKHMRWLREQSEK